VADLASELWQPMVPASGKALQINRRKDRGFTLQFTTGTTSKTQPGIFPEVRVFQNCSTSRSLNTRASALRLGADRKQKMIPREGARVIRVERWLAAGGTVLAASERSARSVAAAFHAARQAEGRTAWPTPAIFTWDGWVRERWLERNRAGVMLLNPLQEQALWSEAIGSGRTGQDDVALLHPRRLAAAAQRAYRLLCDYAPGALKASERMGWSGDSAIFSEWMEVFAARCRREGLASSSRLVLDLTEGLRSGIAPSVEESTRKPLLLVGFDRLLPTQKALLDVWGEWRQDEPDEKAQTPKLLTISDAATEVEACVNWLRARLAAEPAARLMVISTALQERRGELERALLGLPEANSENLDFEFSLGVPLGQVALARSAILLLRWLHDPLSEAELDWLIGSSHSAVSAEEETALSEAMRKIRRRGKEQPEWRLDDFASASETAGGPPALSAGEDAWQSRLIAAREWLRTLPSRQSPLEWVAVAEKLLEAMAWPGFRPLSSVAFQAQQRWERVLEECGSLGFDGSRMTFAEFVSTVAETVSATIFAEESRDARIQITEPLESAGQLADGIWFLGANEENWPGRSQPHPLLPIGLQREAGMPHASPQADWDLAQTATLRLLASASEVIFSYAKHSGEIEARPSRLVMQLAGQPADLPPASSGTSAPDLTERFEDGSLIPFPLREIGGGAGTLTRQSLCPFQAFATSRLNAEDWQQAEAGLTPKQRGQLLHAVLHPVWGGRAEGGISSLDELRAISDLRSFVSRTVRTAMEESFDSRRRNSLPERFPARYLELEAERLARLVTEWLEYERERQPFTVAGTEVSREVTVAGLTLTVRLDRVDQLQSGGKLVIDYKTSNVGPSAWAGERPDDVQLPLYATFAEARDTSDDLEGLVFARIRPGEMKFAGRVRNAVGSLRADLSKQSGLVANPLTDEQLQEWREGIERLGENFLAGRADVDPKDPVKTCKSCHLHAVCRIYENQPVAALLDEDSEEQDGSRNEGDADA